MWLGSTFSSSVSSRLSRAIKPEVPRWSLNLRSSRVPQLLNAGDEAIIMGIESSCDDSCCGILRCKVTDLGELTSEILANETSSQFEIHREYGGIRPNLAARAHKKNLPLVAVEAIKQARIGWDKVDAIGLTHGPGMSPCLWAGIRLAQDLATEWDLPILTVNHLEGHALMSQMPEQTRSSFPYLALIASGGHTSLIYVRNVHDYIVIGETLDDAVGEAFDKVARGICIPSSENMHPGKALEVLAREGCPDKVPFTVPLAKSLNCEFSFSGLKASAFRFLEKKKGEKTVSKADVAASFQDVAFSHLVQQTRRALTYCGAKVLSNVKRSKASTLRRAYLKDLKRSWPEELKGLEPPKSLVVSGGVASNQVLRERLHELANAFGIPLHCPPPKLCVDNGIMVAWAASELLFAKREQCFLTSAFEKQLLEPLPRLKIDSMS